MAPTYKGTGTMPMADTPTVPADPNFALPRETTDFGYDAELLVTYLRLGWIDNALGEIEWLLGENEEQIYSCDPFGEDDDFVAPYDKEELERIGQVLNAMPPLVRAGRFKEALDAIERESTTRNASDVEAAYKAAMAERRQHEATP
jgi:hypothetical protein